MQLDSYERAITEAGIPLQKNVYPLQALYQPPTLNQLLEMKQYEEIEDKLESIFEELSREKVLSNEYLLEVFFLISGAFIYVAHSSRHLSNLVGEDIRKLTNSENFTAEEIKSWSFKTLEKIKVELEQSQIGERCSVIHQVQAFIEENLGEDVSLQTIAEHVYLHPAYLSKIYKMETGEGLSDFIYKLRMEKASKYLLTSNRKVNEIAKALGYQNASYFIRVFKDLFGRHPKNLETLNLIIIN